MRTPNFDRALAITIVSRMEAAGGAIVANAQASLERSGSGEVHGKARHQASSAGEPPVTQSGRLSRSISSRVVSDDGVLQTQAGTTEFYGRFLEGGTARMQPRPFLAPATIGDGKQNVVDALNGKGGDDA